MVFPRAGVADFWGVTCSKQTNIVKLQYGRELDQRYQIELWVCDVDCNSDWTEFTHISLAATITFSARSIANRMSVGYYGTTVPFYDPLRLPCLRLPCSKSERSSSSLVIYGGSTAVLRLAENDKTSLLSSNLPVAVHKAFISPTHWACSRLKKQKSSEYIAEVWLANDWCADYMLEPSLTCTSTYDASWSHICSTLASQLPWISVQQIHNIWGIQWTSSILFRMSWVMPVDLLIGSDTILHISYIWAREMETAPICIILICNSRQHFCDTSWDRISNTFISLIGKSLTSNNMVLYSDRHVNSTMAISPI